jgi:CheY-like chemotaxis protein
LLLTISSLPTPSQIPSPSLSVLFFTEPGITATRKARELGLTIPIIVLSAELGDEVKNAAFIAGATDFISKPASSATIYAVLSGSFDTAANEPTT